MAPATSSRAGSVRMLVVSSMRLWRMAAMTVILEAVVSLDLRPLDSLRGLGPVEGIPDPGGLAEASQGQTLAVGREDQ